MTTASVATVVRCGDLLRCVYPTLESVARQTVGCAEVVLVTDDHTATHADQWLTALAKDRGLSVVRANGDRPGGGWNAAIRQTRSEYVVCLDAGDELAATYHASCSDVLEQHPDVNLVTTETLIRGPGAHQHVLQPRACGLEELLENTTAIHSGSMFRREVWESLGGFDENLKCLADYEFFLRILNRGPGACVPQPLLIRVWRREALYQRFWGTEAYLESFDRVVERHRKVFEAAVVRSLYERERALQAVSGEYQTLMARHEATKEEIDALTVRSEQLRDELPPHARHSIDFSDLRRVSPVAQDWGYERGVPVDRFYIEGFLEQHASDVRGAVLEVQEADYTKRFGGESVTRSDVLDLDVENTRATVVSDLRAAVNIADGVYDCVILTQTAHVIDDIRAVVSEVARILKPGGVVLATLPCASRVCLEYGHDGDFWRVTEDGAREVFSRSFPADGLDVKAKGNVLANAAFLYGLACHELTPDELTTNDPYNPLLVTVRAQKSKPRVMESAPRTSRQPERAGGRGGTHGAAVLLYHRVATVDEDIHGLCVHPAVFRAQMQCLCDRYHPMPLVELLEACQADAAPEGAVSLTFDDGYLDNYSTASPILTELGIPAVFFVTTDKLDEPDPYEFWWDVVEESLLSETRERPVTLSLTLPGGARVFPTRTHADRLETHWAVYEVLSGLPPAG